MNLKMVQKRKKVSYGKRIAREQHIRITIFGRGRRCGQL